MKSLLPLAAAAALFLGFSAPASADMASLGTAGNWVISADDSLCTAHAGYQDGTKLGFAINSTGVASLSIQNPTWNIPEGNYSVVSWVDRSAPLKHEAAAARGWIVWHPAFSLETLNLLSQGAVLYAQVGRQTYDYRLTGSAEMVRAVVLCLQQRVAKANPFSGTQGIPTSSNPFSGN
jgi:hypothetical protein